MTAIIECVLIWIASGVLAAGFLRQHERHTRSYWVKTDNYDDVAINIGMGLFLGPILLIVSFFVTGFWHHGWSLNKNDYTKDDTRP